MQFSFCDPQKPTTMKWRVWLNNMRIFTFVWTIPLSKAGRYVRNNGELLWNPKPTVQRVLLYLMYEMYGSEEECTASEFVWQWCCVKRVWCEHWHKHTGGFPHLVDVIVASGRGGEKWHGTWRHGKPCWKTKNYKTHPRKSLLNQEKGL